MHRGALTHVPTASSTSDTFPAGGCQTSPSPERGTQRRACPHLRSPPGILAQPWHLGVQLNTPGGAGAALGVMERQQQGGVSWMALPGCACWFGPPPSPPFLRDAELPSSRPPALITLRMLLLNQQPGDAAATLPSAWWASPPGPDSGFRLKISGNSPPPPNMHFQLVLKQQRFSGWLPAIAGVESALGAARASVRAEHRGFFCGSGRSCRGGGEAEESRPSSRFPSEQRLCAREGKDPAIQSPARKTSAAGTMLPVSSCCRRATPGGCGRDRLSQPRARGWWHCLPGGTACASEDREYFATRFAFAACL